MTARKRNATLYLTLLNSTPAKTELSPGLFDKVTFFTIISSFLDASFGMPGVWEMEMLKKIGRERWKPTQNLCHLIQCNFRHIRFSLSIFILIPIWSQSRFVIVKFPVKSKVLGQSYLDIVFFSGSQICYLPYLFAFECILNRCLYTML